MVLVFKTNIEEKFEIEIKNLLHLYFNKNSIKIDFDFEDCDNILRIESKLDIIYKVEILLNSKGFYCKEL